MRWVEEDTEFYSRGDEYNRIQRSYEFHRNSEEYFIIQKSTGKKIDKKSNKRKIERISKVVVTIAYIVVAAASVHISYPKAEAVVDMAPVDTVGFDAPNQIPDSEEVIRISDTSTVTEEILSLSENQKEFIQKAWNAFKADDQDILENLLNEESFDELSREEFQGKVFLVDEDVVFENREKFSGKGLLLKQKNKNRLSMFCVNLTEGAAEGDGKGISLNSSEGSEEDSINRNYYSGGWKNNRPSGEGVMYCRHEVWFHYDTENSYRFQNDVGQGYFLDGVLVDGSGQYSWTENGTSDWEGNFDREISMTHSYKDGYIESTKVYEINHITGEEGFTNQVDEGEQNHFIFSKISN